MRFSIEQAKEIAEKLKLKYKFGKSSCPKWFRNTCVAMHQDGSYSVEVCIPSWFSITEQESNEFLEPFEGCMIHLRVVTEAAKYVFDQKKHDTEVEEKKNAKKKKRSPNRKGYR